MKSEKSTALISYLGFIGLLIAYLNNIKLESDFVSFHIRQSFGLCLTFFMLGYLVGSFDSWMITITFWVFIFALNIYGIKTAISGSKKPVPLVGVFIQKIFKKIS